MIYKNILLCFFLLASALKLFAIDDTTVHHYNPLWTKYVYSYEIEFADEGFTLDTSLDLFEMYNPAYSKSEFQKPKWYHSSLGNLGSASFSFGELSYGNDFHLGLDAYQAYAYTTDQVKFYNTKKPFTDLGYVQGLYNEQMLHIVHTQNISPN